MLHPLARAAGDRRRARSRALTAGDRSAQPRTVEAGDGGASHRQHCAEDGRRNAEVIQAMGLGSRLAGAWHQHSERFLGRSAARLPTCGRHRRGVAGVFRLILQSAMLGLGAYLVINGEATAGVMIASSIMPRARSRRSRSRSPIGAASSPRARAASGCASSSPKLPQAREPLSPAPANASRAVEGLTVGAPGQQRPIMQNVSFALDAGEALGVIGPSASGKSTLARALVGAWPPLRGTIRLDGAALDQWDAGGARPRHRLSAAGHRAVRRHGCREHRAASSPDAERGRDRGRAGGRRARHDPAACRRLRHARSARAAPCSPAGQRQRIALARALYGDPFFVVLDEPNSNLDAEGDAALADAIHGVRARGGIVVVIAHRPAALPAVDQAGW